jgi:hypothetical protein
LKRSEKERLKKRGKPNLSLKSPNLKNSDLILSSINKTQGKIIQ